MYALNAVQTKHGGEFGQKQLRRETRVEAGSSLMASLPKPPNIRLTHQGQANFSSVVAAVGTGREVGGHAVAPTVGLAVMAPVSCAQIY